MVISSEALGSCVNDLPTYAARQCGDWGSNERLVDHKSSTLTNMLQSLD